MKSQTNRNNNNNNLRNVCRQGSIGVLCKGLRQKKPRANPFTPASVGELVANDATAITSFF
jgi:hypothetical protein